MLLLIVIMIERKTENNILDSILAFDVRYRVLFYINNCIYNIYTVCSFNINKYKYLHNFLYKRVYSVYIIYIQLLKGDINENYIEEHQ